MNNPVDLDQEFKKIVDLNATGSGKVSYEPIPEFLRDRPSIGELADAQIGLNRNPTQMPNGSRILLDAANIVANENPALYGDQVEYNLAVCGLVNWMSDHRGSSIGEATMSELVQFARQFTKIIKGTVHNSESYSQAAASLGTAAECAAKEDRQ